jgi:hypothetical protein
VADYLNGSESGFEMTGKFAVGGLALFVGGPFGLIIGVTGTAIVENPQAVGNGIASTCQIPLLCSP